MGEQNRRVVEGEGTPGDAAKPRAPAGGARPPAPDADRALSVEADERQTVRQAPAGAGPGESSEDDSIG